MLRSFSLGLCAAALAGIAFAPTAVRADQPKAALPMPCADLMHLDLPHTRINSGVEVPAAPFPFANITPTCTSDVTSPQLPAFCRVMGTIEPQINFEVW